MLWSSYPLANIARYDVFCDEFSYIGPLIAPLDHFLSSSLTEMSSLSWVVMVDAQDLYSSRLVL
jgi:hypothetical protein